jgi:hypothetical protein
MYYLELIQRFWEFNQQRSIGSTAISVYLFLLKTGHDNDRYDFELSDATICKQLGLTRKTIISTKEKLRQSGLIGFTLRSGRSCSYRIILNYPMQLNEYEVTAVQELSEDIMPEPGKQESSQRSYQGQDVRSIPSIEEFLDYAGSLKTYSSKLEVPVKEKYYNWINNGWQNISGRSISNWKSLLKSLLPYMDLEEGGLQSALQKTPIIRRPKQ